MESMISLGKLYFFLVTPTCIIDLFHNGGLLIHSFTCMVMYTSSQIPRETVSFVFPRVLMFPSTSSRETSGLEGKQN